MLAFLKRYFFFIDPQLTLEMQIQIPAWFLNRTLPPLFYTTHFVLHFYYKFHDGVMRSNQIPPHYSVTWCCVIPNLFKTALIFHVVFIGAVLFWQAFDRNVHIRLRSRVLSSQQWRPDTHVIHAVPLASDLHVDMWQANSSGLVISLLKSNNFMGENCGWKDGRCHLRSWARWASSATRQQPPPELDEDGGPHLGWPDYRPGHGAVTTSQICHCRCSGIFHYTNQEPQPPGDWAPTAPPEISQWWAASYLVSLIKDPNSFLLALHHRLRLIVVVGLWVQSGRFGALRCNLWDLSPFWVFFHTAKPQNVLYRRLRSWITTGFVVEELKLPREEQSREPDYWEVTLAKEKVVHVNLVVGL